MRKQFAIKRKYNKNTKKYWYYPVHSYLGIIWSYYKIDTGKTYPVFGPCGFKTLQPLYQKVCFDDIEEAKAYIGKIIFDNKTKEEQKEMLIRLAPEIYERVYTENRSNESN